MRATVTGGCGFIGSHVVDRLIEAGHDVVVVDRQIRALNSAAEYVEADVLDVEALGTAMVGSSVVYHLAGMSNVDIAAAHPLLTVQLNIDGTAAVLEAARQQAVDRVVLASTVWVYGAAAGDGELHEDAAMLPQQAGHIYTSSKLAAELLVHSYRELYGQHFTILRYGIPFGPRMRDELVIARFVQRALRGEPLTIAGDGSQTRNYVYVEDLADAHLLAAGPAAEDQVFAVDGPEPISIRDIVDTVADIVGNVTIEQVPARPGDYQARPVSTALASEVLGWTPTTTFADGVRRYLDWYRSTSLTSATPE